MTAETRAQNFKLENSQMFESLRKVAAERVAKEDYNYQIDRWNQYQELLDKVDRKTGGSAGVELRRNVKTNWKTWTAPGAAFFGTAMFIAVTVLMIGIVTRNIFCIVGGAGAAIYFGREIFDRFLPSETITFQTSPKLHFDELAKARSMIKRIPEVKRDPVIALPTLYMRIPRRWFGQQGMLDFMKGLDDIDWKTYDAMRRSKNKK